MKEQRKAEKSRGEQRRAEEQREAQERAEMKKRGTEHSCQDRCLRRLLCAVYFYTASYFACGVILCTTRDTSLGPFLRPLYGQGKMAWPEDPKLDFKPALIQTHTKNNTMFCEQKTETHNSTINKRRNLNRRKRSPYNSDSEVKRH